MENNKISEKTQQLLREWLHKNHPAEIADNINLEGAILLLLKSKGSKTVTVETKKPLSPGIKSVFAGAMDTLGKIGANVNKSLEREHS